jgi:hypothetical protein
MIWAVLVLSSVAAGWLSGRGDAAENWREAEAGAPAALLLASFGGTLGLFGRDRLRRRISYASPTRSYAGKAVAATALSAAATFVLSPVAWPPGCLLVSAAVFAAGLALWLANLPRRL